MTTLDAETLRLLQNAESRISSIANRDCDCDWQNGVPTDDSASCETCQCRLAQIQIRLAITPHARTLHPNRLRNLAERVFFEQWVAMAQRYHRDEGLDGPDSLLKLILQPECDARPPVISQRDWDVATSIIQWLGTQCGRGFVIVCESRIRELDKQLSGIDHQGYFVYDRQHAPPQVADCAEAIACAFVSVQNHPAAAKQLTTAICSAINHFVKLNNIQNMQTNERAIHDV